MTSDCGETQTMAHLLYVDYLMCLALVRTSSLSQRGQRCMPEVAIYCVKAEEKQYCLLYSPTHLKESAVVGLLRGSLYILYGGDRHNVREVDEAFTRRILRAVIVPQLSKTYHPLIIIIQTTFIAVFADFF